MKRILIVTGGLGNKWIKVTCNVVKVLIGKHKILILLEDTFIERLVKELKVNHVPISEKPRIGYVALRAISKNKIEEYMLKLYNSYRFNMLIYILRPRRSTNGLYYDEECRVARGLKPLENIAYLIKSSTRNITTIGIASSPYHIGASKIANETTCVELEDVPIDILIYETDINQIVNAIRELKGLEL